uniref:SFRICE_013437 n=1 Tax=Spodoptera frugiperda TaxID=7108 RepID=A0A2H1VGJ4_SPOFR
MIDDCDDYGDVFLCKNNLCFIFSYKSYSSTKYKRLKNNYIFIITFVRHTKLIIMLSAYSRNCLSSNSTSFKPY